MPKNTAALRSPAAQNLLAAAVTGATVLVRPARVPTWLRRGLTVANTAGTAGSLFMSKDEAANGGALGVKPVTGAKNTAASAGSALAAATGGIGLMTSGIGLKLDTKVENYLLRKGVKHPRWWMAVGAVGLVFVMKTVQDAATKKTEDAAKKLAAKAQQQAPAGANVPADRSATPTATPTVTPKAALKSEPTAPKAAPEVEAKTESEAETEAPTAETSATPTYDAMRAGLGDGGSTAAARNPESSSNTTDSQKDSTNGSKPSLFEQQLAETTVEDVDDQA